MMLFKCLVVSEQLIQRLQCTGSHDVTVGFFKFVIFEYGCQDNLCWLLETYSAPSHEILLQGNTVPDFTVCVKPRVN